MVLDKSANVYATGNIYPTGGTIDSIATIKIDASGSVKWTRKYSSGTYSLDEPSAIAIDSLGFIYIVCRSSKYATILKYDSLGNQIWVTNYENSQYSIDLGNSICLAKNGDIYMGGTTYGTNSDGMLVVKYSFDVGINEITKETNVLSIFPILPPPTSHSNSLPTLALPPCKSSTLLEPWCMSKALPKPPL